MKNHLLSVALLAGSVIAAGSAYGLTMDQKVVVGSQFVHAVRTGAGGFSAEDRVAQINERINKIISKEPLTPSNIRLRMVGSSPGIFVGRYLLTTVTQADAESNHTTQRALAQRWLQAYRSALPQARPDSNWGVKER